MMTAKSLLLLSLLAKVAVHTEATTETLTIVAEIPVPTTFGPETLTGYSSIFTNGTSNETIGTFTLGCSLITTNPTFQLFSPCINIFTFNGPDGTMATSEDTLMIDGMSILASFTNTTQLPQLQKFAIIGGTGKYLGASGSMSASFSTFPGRSTFTATVDIPDSPTVAGEPIIVGYVPVPPSTSFFINGYSSIYNPSNRSQTIGTFALVCPKIIYPGLDVFMNCMLLFYFYNETEGIGSTQDTIVGTGLSLLANISDFTQPPVLQNFAISGGTGKYKGIKGSILNSYETNAGFNTFSPVVFQESSGRNRALAKSDSLRGEPNPSATRELQEQPSMVISVPVFPRANGTEVVTGFGLMYNSNNLEQDIGTFTVACFVLNNPDVQVFDPCMTYFYFHGVDGIQTTENGFMAFGWDIVTDPTHLKTPGTVVGGFGSYESVTGYLIRDLASLSDGYLTFSIYLDTAPTPPAPTPSAPSPSAPSTSAPSPKRGTSSATEKSLVMAWFAFVTIVLTLFI